MAEALRGANRALYTPAGALRGANPSQNTPAGALRGGNPPLGGPTGGESIAEHPCGGPTGGRSTPRGPYGGSIDASGALRGVDLDVEGSPGAPIRGHTPLSGEDPAPLGLRNAPLGLRNAPVGGAGGGLGGCRSICGARLGGKHPPGELSGALRGVSTPEFRHIGPLRGASAGADIAFSSPGGPVWRRGTAPDGDRTVLTASDTTKHGEKHPEHGRVRHRKHHLVRELLDECRPGRRRTRRRPTKRVAARAVHRSCSVEHPRARRCTDATSAVHRVCIA